MFVKVFASILDSSLRSEDTSTRWLFLTMLVLGDEAGDGTVDMPVEALAARAGISEEETKAGLLALMAPDPHDRSGVIEGRRLQPLRDIPESDYPGRGWVIVNWPSYRALANRAERQEQLARNSAAYRNRLKEIAALGLERGRRHRTSSAVIKARHEKASSNDIPSDRRQQTPEIPPQAPPRGDDGTRRKTRAEINAEKAAVGNGTAEGAPAMPIVAPGESVLDALSIRQFGRPQPPKPGDATEPEPPKSDAVAPPVHEETQENPPIAPPVEIAPPEPTVAKRDPEVEGLTPEELAKFEADARKLVQQLLERGMTKTQIAQKLGQWKKIWLTSAARQRRLAANA